MTLDIRDTLCECSGVTVKMILTMIFMAVIDFTSAIVSSVGINNMPIVTGVSTANRDAETGATDDLKIMRINIQFFARKHYTSCVLC